MRLFVGLPPLLPPPPPFVVSIALRRDDFEDLVGVVVTNVFEVVVGDIFSRIFVVVPCVALSSWEVFSLEI